MTTDVLMKKPEGQLFYDLSLDENGDLTNGDFFDSSLVYSLLGERRADASEVPVSHQRRGWLGNQGSDFENGSKLWLYEQARLTRTNLNGIQTEAFNSLAWLLEDKLLQDLTVTVSIVNQRVLLEITLFRFNSKVERRYFELWNNTGVC